MIGLPGAGDPPRHVLLHQSFERAEIYDLEENKRLGIFLQPDQNIALDVAEFQRRKPHTPLRATTTLLARRNACRAFGIRPRSTRVSRRWSPRNRPASSRDTSK